VLFIHFFNKNLKINLLHIIFSCIFLSNGLLGFSQPQRPFKLPPGLDKNHYDLHTVIVKVKSSNSGLGRDMQMIRKTTNAKAVTPLFPNHQNKKNLKSKADIENIYKITIENDQSIEEVINQLLQLPEVVYAEPYYYYLPLYIPNDPQAGPNGEQSYLSIIKAYEAWEIQKGDPNMVIGIIDTGVELNHEDLKNNIYINEADPINGIDDDGDGYIDNYYGWDMADNNNDPSDSQGHGTKVTGIASASTNNNLGIAGIGFNTKFMPIKVSRSSDHTFHRSIEAIVYAADMGCNVINLSWGGSYPPSKLAQDIINYAVEEKDVVIIASAGNKNEELDFYPASYQNVLSVGSTDHFDNKASWATFSTNIDLVAPGRQIYSTQLSNKYGKDDGTSYSAPMVSGAAALLRAQFPQWNAKQIMQQLRVQTDNIYHVGNNQSYYEKLGKGRLNIYKALTDTLSPAVRMDKFELLDTNSNWVFFDDTLKIKTYLTNYLHKTSGFKVTLTSTSPYITIIRGEFSPGDLNKLQSAQNQENPFIVYLHPDLPANHRIKFRLGFEGINYADYQYFELRSAPEHLPVENEKACIILSGNGHIGDPNNPIFTGKSILYQKKNILDFAGLILTSSSEKVLNNVVNNTIELTRDEDFSVLQNIKLYQNSVADIDARSTFKEKTQNKTTSLVIDQKLLAWQDTGSSQFMIIEYKINNNTDQTIHNLHCGLFADWNLNDKNKNSASWLSDHKLGLVKANSGENLLAGLALLTNQSPLYYALDNKSLNGNPADLTSEVFSRDKKYAFVSGGVQKTTAGDQGDGNDVAHILGGTIAQLPPFGTTKIAIAFTFGHSMEEIIAAKDKALEKYQQYIENPPLLATHRFCKNESLTITPKKGINFNFYTDLEKINLVYSGEAYQTPPLTENRSLFITSLQQSYEGEIMHIKLVQEESNAEFDVSPNPLYLGDDPRNTVSFFDKSKNAVKWHWDLGNGFTSKVQNPRSRYNQEGTYNITLTTTSQLGCQEEAKHSLQVVHRGAVPELLNQIICKNSTSQISATNTDMIRVYDKHGKNLFEGGTFITGNIISDTSFWVTNIAEPHESQKKEVKIRVSAPKAAFSWTTEINQGLLYLHTHNHSSAANKWLWFWNETLISNETEPQIAFSGEAGLLKLSIIDSLECVGETFKNITPKKSPVPEIDHIHTCPNTIVNLAPTNGRLFHFYEDKNKETLLHTGYSFAVPLHYQPVSIFITNLDSLLESDIKEVKITLDSIQARFYLSTDTLNLKHTNKLVVTDQSIRADNRAWNLGNGIIKTTPNIEQRYFETGQYLISLMVSNLDGCTDILTKPLLVIHQDEPLSTHSNDTNKGFLVYPNPAKERFFINTDANGFDGIVTIFNNLGNRVYQQKLPLLAIPYSIETYNFPKGMYIVYYQVGNQTYSQKLTIK
jgi:subtilisin family serine protease/PKD repeat protein